MSSGSGDNRRLVNGKSFSIVKNSMTVDLSEDSWRVWFSKNKKKKKKKDEKRPIERKEIFPYLLSVFPYSAVLRAKYSHALLRFPLLSIFLPLSLSLSRALLLKSIIRNGITKCMKKIIQEREILPSIQTFHIDKLVTLSLFPLSRLCMLC